MPTVTSKGRRHSDRRTETVSSQSLVEPHQDHLRNLVFDYLCHNCYLKTAEAFARDSGVRHLDKDGNELSDSTIVRVGDAMGTISPQGSSTDLSDGMVQNIMLRKSIQSEILSGNVKEAIVLLNRHFPKVLAEDCSDEMEVTDENVNPSRLEYVGETVNPIHLSLNLHILAFIEACRTVPLVYAPPSSGAGGTISLNSRAAMVAASPKKRDIEDEEKLIRAQTLRATVLSLRKPDDRAIYEKELDNVAALLAYAVPENSPWARYLHQERRDRVAEQINSAILHCTSLPSVSHLELAVRYTHCLWAALHDLRVKVPSSVSLLLGTAPQGSGESEKEPFQEARPFDLQLFLNTRA